MSSGTVPVSGHLEKRSFTPAKVGMLAFLVSEVAFFSTLIMTYAFYLDQIRTGTPRPADILTFYLVIPGTFCLLLSSVTVHFAEASLHKGNQALFLLLWGATIALGVGFLVLTALEWKELIGTHGLTIGRNMFGTCFFTLVGFHAAHVTLGVIMLSVIWMMVQRGRLGPNATAPVLVSWYWHFVDVVWIVVFTLVYVIGR
jgi:cytochrome c oxidase subunit 3/cytochrome o ubiquinol oxidase subunit 3